MNPFVPAYYLRNQPGVLAFRCPRCDGVHTHKLVPGQPAPDSRSRCLTPETKSPSYQLTPVGGVASTEDVPTLTHDEWCEFNSYF